MNCGVVARVAAPAALAIAGLLGSLVGPALDHHFGERQPDHRHVYVHTTGVAHEHQLDAHSHSPDGDAGQMAGVISVAAHDAAAGGQPAVPDVSFADDTPRLVSRAAGRPPKVVSDDARPPSQSPTPEDQPPKV